MHSKRRSATSNLNRIEDESRPDLALFAATLVLVGFGTIMVYSSSAIYAWASSEYGSGFFFLKRHLVRLFIGLGAMLVAERIDYRVWSKVAKPLIGLSIFLLVIVLFVGFRWLRFSFVSLQPSEVARVCLVIYLAAYMAARVERIKSLGKGLLPPLIVLGLTTALVVKQPNFGTAAAILIIGFIVLYVGGSRVHHLVLAGLVGAVAVGLVAYTIPYARQRIAGFVGASSGNLESNYQLRQSLLGLGSGGVFGEGLGRSKIKLLSLPEPHTDFVFAVMAEEMGFVGSVILMGLFLFVMIRGMRIAMLCPDNFGTLLAFGLSVSIFVYALLHVAVVLGALPTTGLPMPFLSFGGSALFTNLVSMGIILSISKHRHRARPVSGRARGKR